MRLMPFGPHNSGSIFIDNSSAKSATHAKQEFASNSNIWTYHSKLTPDKLSTSVGQTDNDTSMRNLGEPLAIKYLTHFSRQTHTLLTSPPIAADCGSALWRLYLIRTKNESNWRLS